MPHYTEKTGGLPRTPDAALQTCLEDIWHTKQDSEGNEENGYPVLDSNKIKINDAKEPNGCPQEHPQRRNPASNH
jgi:hypothetical protein